MPDIYVVVGSMTHIEDTKKVAIAYRELAGKTMKATVVASLAAVEGKGFTTTKPTDGKGYEISLTLVEVNVGGTIQDRPAVKCNLNGTIASLPGKEIINKTLTGTATVGGSGTRVTEGDVIYCIEEAVKKTMTKSVLPTLKNLKP